MDSRVEEISLVNSKSNSFYKTKLADSSNYHALVVCQWCVKKRERERGARKGAKEREE